MAAVNTSQVILLRLFALVAALLTATAAEPKPPSSYEEHLEYAGRVLRTVDTSSSVSGMDGWQSWRDSQASNLKDDTAFTHACHSTTRLSVRTKVDGDCTCASTSVEAHVRLRRALTSLAGVVTPGTEDKLAVESSNCIVDMACADGESKVTQVRVRGCAIAQDVDVVLNEVHKGQTKRPNMPLRLEFFTYSSATKQVEFFGSMRSADASLASVASRLRVKADFRVSRSQPELAIWQVALREPSETVTLANVAGVLGNTYTAFHAAFGAPGSAANRAGTDAGSTVLNFFVAKVSVRRSIVAACVGFVDEEVGSHVYATGQVDAQGRLNSYSVRRVTGIVRITERGGGEAEERFYVANYDLCGSKWEAQELRAYVTLTAASGEDLPLTTGNEIRGVGTSSLACAGLNKPPKQTSGLTVDFSTVIVPQPSVSTVVEDRGCLLADKDILLVNVTASYRDITHQSDLLSKEGAKQVLFAHGHDLDEVPFVEVEFTMKLGMSGSDLGLTISNLLLSATAMTGMSRFTKLLNPGLQGQLNAAVFFGYDLGFFMPGKGKLGLMDAGGMEFGGMARRDGDDDFDWSMFDMRAAQGTVRTSHKQGTTVQMNGLLPSMSELDETDEDRTVATFTITLNLPPGECAKPQSYQGEWQTTEGDIAKFSVLNPCTPDESSPSGESSYSFKHALGFAPTLSTQNWDAKTKAICYKGFTVGYRITAEASPAKSDVSITLPKGNKLVLKSASVRAVLATGQSATEMQAETTWEANDLASASKGSFLTRFEDTGGKSPVTFAFVPTAAESPTAQGFVDASLSIAGASMTLASVLPKGTSAGQALFLKMLNTITIDTTHTEDGCAIDAKVPVGDGKLETIAISCFGSIASEGASSPVPELMNDATYKKFMESNPHYVSDVVDYLADSPDDTGIGMIGISGKGITAITLIENAVPEFAKIIGTLPLKSSSIVFATKEGFYRGVVPADDHLGVSVVKLYDDEDPLETEDGWKSRRKDSEGVKLPKGTVFAAKVDTTLGIWKDLQSSEFGRSIYDSTVGDSNKPWFVERVFVGSMPFIDDDKGELAIDLGLELRADALWNGTGVSMQQGGRAVHDLKGQPDLTNEFVLRGTMHGEIPRSLPIDFKTIDPDATGEKVSWDAYGNMIVSKSSKSGAQYAGGILALKPKGMRGDPDSLYLSEYVRFREGLVFAQLNFDRPFIHCLGFHFDASSWGMREPTSNETQALNEYYRHQVEVHYKSDKPANRAVDAFHITAHIKKGTAFEVLRPLVDMASTPVYSEDSRSMLENVNFDGAVITINENAEGAERRHHFVNPDEPYCMNRDKTATTSVLVDDVGIGNALVLRPKNVETKIKLKLDLQKAGPGRYADVSESSRSQYSFAIEGSFFSRRASIGSFMLEPLGLVSGAFHSRETVKKINAASDAVSSATNSTRGQAMEDRLDSVETTVRMRSQMSDGAPVFEMQIDCLIATLGIMWLAKIHHLPATTARDFMTQKSLPLPAAFQIKGKSVFVMDMQFNTRLDGAGLLKAYAVTSTDDTHDRSMESYFVMNIDPTGGSADANDLNALTKYGESVDRIIEEHWKTIASDIGNSMQSLNRADLQSKCKTDPLHFGACIALAYQMLKDGDSNSRLRRALKATPEDVASTLIDAARVMRNAKPRATKLRKIRVTGVENTKVKLLVALDEHVSVERERLQRCLDTAAKPELCATVQEKLNYYLNRRNTLYPGKEARRLLRHGQSGFIGPLTAEVLGSVAGGIEKAFQLEVDDLYMDAFAKNIMTAWFADIHESFAEDFVKQAGSQYRSANSDSGGACQDFATVKRDYPLSACSRFAPPSSVASARSAWKGWDDLAGLVDMARALHRDGLREQGHVDPLTSLEESVAIAQPSFTLATIVATKPLDASQLSDDAKKNATKLSDDMRETLYDEEKHIQVTSGKEEAARPYGLSADGTAKIGGKMETGDVGGHQLKAYVTDGVALPTLVEAYAETTNNERMSRKVYISDDDSNEYVSASTWGAVLWRKTPLEPENSSLISSYGLALLSRELQNRSISDCPSETDVDAGTRRVLLADKTSGTSSSKLIRVARNASTRNSLARSFAWACFVMGGGLLSAMFATRSGGNGLFSRSNGGFRMLSGAFIAGLLALATFSRVVTAQNSDALVRWSGKALDLGIDFANEAFNDKEFDFTLPNGDLGDLSTSEVKLKGKVTYKPDEKSVAITASTSDTFTVKYGELMNLEVSELSLGYANKPEAKFDLSGKVGGLAFSVGITDSKLKKLTLKGDTTSTDGVTNLVSAFSSMFGSSFKLKSIDLSIDDEDGDSKFDTAVAMGAEIYSSEATVSGKWVASTFSSFSAKLAMDTSEIELNGTPFCGENQGDGVDGTLKVKLPKAEDKLVVTAKASATCNGKKISELKIAGKVDALKLPSMTFGDLELGAVTMKGDVTYVTQPDGDKSNEISISAQTTDAFAVKYGELMNLEVSELSLGYANKPEAKFDLSGKVGGLAFSVGITDSKLKKLTLKGDTTSSDGVTNLVSAFSSMFGSSFKLKSIDLSIDDEDDDSKFDTAVAMGAEIYSSEATVSGKWVASTFSSFSAKLAMDTSEIELNGTPFCGENQGDGVDGTLKVKLPKAEDKLVVTAKASATCNGKEISELKIAGKVDALKLPSMTFGDLELGAVTMKGDVTYVTQPDGDKSNEISISAQTTDAFTVKYGSDLNLEVSELSLEYANKPESKFAFAGKLGGITMDLSIKDGDLEKLALKGDSGEKSEKGMDNLLKKFSSMFGDDFELDKVDLSVIASENKKDAYDMSINFEAEVWSADAKIGAKFVESTFTEFTAQLDMGDTSVDLSGTPFCVKDGSGVTGKLGFKVPNSDNELKVTATGTPDCDGDKVKTLALKGSIDEAVKIPMGVLELDVKKLDIEYKIDYGESGANGGLVLAAEVDSVKLDVDVKQEQSIYKLTIGDKESDSKAVDFDKAAGKVGDSDGKLKSAIPSALTGGSISLQYLEVGVTIEKGDGAKQVQYNMAVIFSLGGAKVNGQVTAMSTKASGFQATGADLAVATDTFMIAFNYKGGDKARREGDDNNNDKSTYAADFKLLKELGSGGTKLSPFELKGTVQVSADGSIDVSVKKGDKNIKFSILEKEIEISELSATYSSKTSALALNAKLDNMFTIDTTAILPLTQKSGARRQSGDDDVGVKAVKISAKTVAMESLAKLGAIGSLLGKDMAEIKGEIKDLKLDYDGTDVVASGTFQYKGFQFNVVKAKYDGSAKKLSEFEADVVILDGDKNEAMKLSFSGGPPCGVDGNGGKINAKLAVKSLPFGIKDLEADGSIEFKCKDNKDKTSKIVDTFKVDASVSVDGFGVDFDGFKFTLSSIKVSYDSETKAVKVLGMVGADNSADVGIEFDYTPGDKKSGGSELSLNIKVLKDIRFDTLHDKTMSKEAKEKALEATNDKNAGEVGKDIKESMVKKGSIVQLTKSGGDIRFALVGLITLFNADLKVSLVGENMLSATKRRFLIEVIVTSKVSNLPKVVQSITDKAGGSLEMTIRLATKAGKYTVPKVEGDGKDDDSSRRILIVDDGGNDDGWYNGSSLVIPSNGGVDNGGVEYGHHSPRRFLEVARRLIAEEEDQQNDDVETIDMTGLFMMIVKQGDKDPFKDAKGDKSPFPSDGFDTSIYVTIVAFAPIEFDIYVSVAFKDATWGEGDCTTKTQLENVQVGISVRSSSATLFVRSNFVFTIPKCDDSEPPKPIDGKSPDVLNLLGALSITLPTFELKGTIRLKAAKDGWNNPFDVHPDLTLKSVMVEIGVTPPALTSLAIAADATLGELQGNVHLALGMTPIPRAAFGLGLKNVDTSKVFDMLFNAQASTRNANKGQVSDSSFLVAKEFRTWINTGKAVKISEDVTIEPGIGLVAKEVKLLYGLFEADELSLIAQAITEDGGNGVGGSLEIFANIKPINIMNIIKIEGVAAENPVFYLKALATTKPAIIVCTSGKVTLFNIEMELTFFLTIGTGDANCQDILTEKGVKLPKLEDNSVKIPDAGGAYIMAGLKWGDLYARATIAASTYKVWEKDASMDFQLSVGTESGKGIVTVLLKQMVDFLTTMLKEAVNAILEFAKGSIKRLREQVQKAQKGLDDAKANVNSAADTAQKKLNDAYSYTNWCKGQYNYFVQECCWYCAAACTKKAYYLAQWKVGEGLIAAAKYLVEKARKGVAGVLDGFKDALSLAEKGLKLGEEAIQLVQNGLNKALEALSKGVDFATEAGDKILKISKFEVATSIGGKSGDSARDTIIFTKTDKACAGITETNSVFGTYEMVKGMTKHGYPVYKHREEDRWMYVDKPSPNDGYPKGSWGISSETTMKNDVYEGFVWWQAQPPPGQYPPNDATWALACGQTSGDEGDDSGEWVAGTAKSEYKKAAPPAKLEVTLNLLDSGDKSFKLGVDDLSLMELAKSVMRGMTDIVMEFVYKQLPETARKTLGLNSKARRRRVRRAYQQGVNCSNIDEVEACYPRCCQSNYRDGDITIEDSQDATDNINDIGSGLESMTSDQITSASLDIVLSVRNNMHESNGGSALPPYDPGARADKPKIGTVLLAYEPRVGERDYTGDDLFKSVQTVLTKIRRTPNPAIIPSVVPACDACGTGLTNGYWYYEIKPVLADDIPLFAAAYATRRAQTELRFEMMGRGSLSPTLVELSAGSIHRMEETLPGTINAVKPNAAVTEMTQYHYFDTLSCEAGSGTTTTTLPSKNDSSSLSGGAIAGIVIAVFFAVAAIGFVVVFVIRKKKQSRDTKQPSAVHDKRRELTSFSFGVEEMSELSADITVSDEMNQSSLVSPAVDSLKTKEGFAQPIPSSTITEVSGTSAEKPSTSLPESDLEKLADKLVEKLGVGTDNSKSLSRMRSIPKDPHPSIKRQGSRVGSSVSVAARRWGAALGHVKQRIHGVVVENAPPGAPYVKVYFPSHDDDATSTGSVEIVDVTCSDSDIRPEQG